MARTVDPDDDNDVRDLRAELATIVTEAKGRNKALIVYIREIDKDSPEALQAGEFFAPPVIVRRKQRVARDDFF